MKSPNSGSKKRQFKTQLAVAGLPVALLIARSLTGNSPTAAWSQNSDLDLPTGRVQPTSTQPADPLSSTLPPAPALDPAPLDSQVPASLPPLDSVAPPVQPEFNNPSPLTLPPLNEAQGGPTPPSDLDQPSGSATTQPKPPGGLLPAGNTATADLVPSDLNDGVGTFSPLWEGAGFGRSVFTPAYLPSYTYASPTPTKYNPYRLNWGPVKGRLYGAVMFEYNDNINLGDKGNRQGDFAITPTAGVGFNWRVSESRNLELNLGLGYRWYLKNSDLNTVVITPSTRAQYNFRIGRVAMNIHDSFTTAVDPTTQGQIGAVTAGPNSLLNYRRIINTLGIGGTWKPTANVDVTGGYDYTIDRTLTDQFRSLDHDQHTFSGGIIRAVPGSRLRLGLAASYTIVDYNRRLQNDGTIWSIGPNATYRLSDTVTLNGSVGYTSTSFDRPTATSIQDTGNFRSVTYQAGVNHRLGQNWNHQLTLTRGASLGIGNNFADHTALQYGIYGLLGRNLRAQGILTWEDFKVSGLGGESANRYLLYVGLRYQLNQSWSSGLGYSYALKESNRLNLDYYQNRVILDITYQF